MFNCILASWRGEIKDGFQKSIFKILYYFSPRGQRSETHCPFNEHLVAFLSQKEKLIQQESKKNSQMLAECHCSSLTSLLVFFFFLQSNKEPFSWPSECHKSNCRTNWLFCLFFLFFLLMFSRQSFDLAKLTEPHHKCLPLRDIFITAWLDAKHLHANAAADKRGCYQQGPGGQTQSIKLLVVGYHLTQDGFSAVNKITTNPLVLFCELCLRCHSRPRETSLCSHQPEVQNPRTACRICAISGTIVNIWIIHWIIFLKILAHLSLQAHNPVAVNAEQLPDIFLQAEDHRNCLSPQIRVTNQKQAVSSWTCVFPHFTLRCIHAAAWLSSLLLHLLLHLSAWSTPGLGCHALRHSCHTQSLSQFLCGKAKIYWGQIFRCALLWFIAFPILIISKRCSFFLLLFLNYKFIHTSKIATRQKGMKCKVRVSICFCQTTIKCYGHIKAHRARWSAQWEYDILHCAGPHSGLCRQLQKNLTIRKNSP